MYVQFFYLKIHTSTELDKSDDWLNYRTHMQDLQEVTQEVHYENFRAEKLAGGAGGTKKTVRYGRG